jgi:phage minor structural protein
MYKIYADNTLIYDSTIEDYKIGKGLISLETNKSGSFVFSIYPDHFFYDSFIRLKTVITVYKSNKIIFRGRILNDVTDYWNNKVITCEGELGFLQDSIIRPFSFNGTPENLFKKFITEHNSQVDEFKRFKIGTVTVIDPNNYIARSNSEYESSLTNLNSRLIEDSLGGYFYITHGDSGTDPIPTINYLADFTKVSAQRIEFGSNLKDYTKTVKANDIATAIIPLGQEVDDENDETENPKLTISSVNDGKDYVYSPEGVALYGWIFKTVSFDDVTVASNLKAKAEEYLESITKQNITIELNAIDLHLLDHSIESFNVCDYIRVISKPHNFDSVLLCSKQTIDLLKPENDTVTLGYTYSTFTETSNKVSSSVSTIVNIRSTVNKLTTRLVELNQTVSDTEKDAESALENYQDVSEALGTISGDLEIVAGVVTENARSIATNAENIAANANNIAANAKDIDELNKKTPIYGISSADIQLAKDAISEINIVFPTPFTVAPAAIMVTPFIVTGTTTGITAALAVSNVTVNGFHVCLKNNGNTATFRLMYVAYPGIEIEEGTN